MKSLLDPSFRYVASADTDLRKTFERVRREMLHPLPSAARIGARAPVGMPVHNYAHKNSSR